MKISLKALFQFLAVYCALIASTFSKECPPPEFVHPCICEYDACITCSNVLNNDVLEDVFKNSGYDFFTLVITDSVMEYIPKSIFQTNSFDKLSVKNSLFTALFDDNPVSDSLSIVSIQNTTILHGFEWNMLNNMNISALELKDNGITELTRSFGSGLSKNIFLIVIEEPFLNSLSDDFLVDLQHLKSFNIHSTKLRRLSKIKFPQSLRWINFSDNEIEVLPNGLFDDIDHLEIVSFINNKLKAVEESIFAKAEMVYVYDNPIVCDCSIKWLLKRKDIFGICDSPSKIKGRYLQNLDKSYFAYCKQSNL